MRKTSLLSEGSYAEPRPIDGQPIGYGIATGLAGLLRPSAAVLGWFVAAIAAVLLLAGFAAVVG